MVDRTLAILKPEAVQRKLVGDIVSMIEKAGFTILAAKLITLDRKLAERHYQVHKGKPFYTGLVDYITSGPIFVMALERENAVEELRRLIGATDPKYAEKNTIRGLYGESVDRNVIYGSDTRENAEFELKVFFTEKELSLSS
jgi:nucleoside-diphosphate kinase